MACRNDFSPSILEKALPLPPPLPSHLTTRFRNKGIKIERSKIREQCLVSNDVYNSWDRLFDEGYRADVSISTDGGAVIYAHASVLGVVSPVLKTILKKSKVRGQKQLRPITIRGVPSEAVRVFIRFLYSSSYEEENMENFSLPLLALSHAYAVPELKRQCENWLEHRLTTENIMDIFQLALLCDAPRLSLICHRIILSNFKAVSATDGWRDMKDSHPILEKELLESMVQDDAVSK